MGGTKPAAVPPGGRGWGVTRIEVTRDVDELNRAEWTFWFEDRNCTLWVDTYHVLTRPSKRHKFRVVGFYQRTDGRQNTIDECDVPLTSDVIAEAKQNIIDQLTVKKWSERK